MDEVDPRPQRRSQDEASTSAIVAVDTSEPVVTSVTGTSFAVGSPSVPTPSNHVPQPTPRNVGFGLGSSQDGGHLASTRVASWMHPDFKMPTDKVDLKKLGEEIAAAVVPLQNLKFTDKLVASYIGLPAITRATNMDSYNYVKEMGVDESANRATALLTRVTFTRTLNG